MKIAYFGNFDPNYCRNKYIIKGLAEAGAQIVEINDHASGLAKYFNLFRKLRKLRGDYDLMIVGFLGHFIMPFAWLLSKRPVVFDAHISFYDAQIIQKNQFSPNGLMAKIYWQLDRLCCVLADYVLLDTNAHIEYFVKTFKLPKDKFICVYNGSDVNDWGIVEKKLAPSKTIIEFHAHVTKMHGFDKIIGAMKILAEADKEIELWCVADGHEWPEFEKMKAEAEKIGNIKFFDPMSPEKLTKEILPYSSIGLGIFGETEKAGRVIPNKIYELMSAGIPTITIDSTAIREVFTDKENIYLIDNNNPETITEAILELKNNPELREKISYGLKELGEKYSPNTLGKQLANDLTARGLWLDKKRTIAAILRIKDEIGLIDKALSRLSELVDYIVIVDNGSTDGTLEAYKKYPKVTNIWQTEGFDEGRDKILLLDVAKTLNPNWLVFLDVDEIFEKNFDRAEIDRMMAKRYSAVNFRFCHHWLSEKRCRIGRKYFFYSMQPLRTMWRNSPQVYFFNEKIHNGVPQKLGRHQYFSPYRIKHYGQADGKKLAEKIKLYTGLDNTRDYSHLDPKKHVLTYPYIEFKNHQLNYVFIMINKYVFHTLWTIGILGLIVTGKYKK